MSSMLFSPSGGLKKLRHCDRRSGGGRIKSITLNDYQAEVVMNVRSEVKLQEDAIAAIKTKGLIGEKYIEITPGASEKIIPAGGKIRETLPPVDFEQLITQYVFGKIQ
jgi:phospholipid/cholesterol/gamma-HCH transport system substrate-binding protein